MNGPAPAEGERRVAASEERPPGRGERPVRSIDQRLPVVGVGQGVGAPDVRGGARAHPVGAARPHHPEHDRRTPLPPAAGGAAARAALRGAVRLPVLRARDHRPAAGTAPAGLSEPDAADPAVRRAVRAPSPRRAGPPGPQASDRRRLPDGGTTPEVRRTAGGRYAEARTLLPRAEGHRAPVREVPRPCAEGTGGRRQHRLRNALSRWYSGRRVERPAAPWERRRWSRCGRRRARCPRGARSRERVVSEEARHERRS